MRASNAAVAFTLALLLLACSGADVTDPGISDGDDARLRVTALVVGTPIDLIVVRVTASDIAVPLVFNLPVQDGVAAGTIRMPPGTARTITLEAFDDAGDITHEGSMTIDVRAGPNPPVNIAMLPRGGEVPVTATLADVSVIITPGTADVAAGETQQFTAQIIGPDDQPVAGTVVWAVTNPAFARVSPTGLVTGVHAGALQLVATYGGVAGVAQLTVSGGPDDPGAGELIFNEVMANPSAVADELGEWLELYNPSGSTIDLTGWIVRTASGSECVLSGSIAPGGYFVAVRNLDPLLNGGVSGHATCAVALTNTSLTLTLLTPAGVAVDVVAFGASNAGLAWNLDPDYRTAADNDSGAGWCLGLALYNGVDAGTPGLANHECPGA